MLPSTWSVSGMNGRGSVHAVDVAAERLGEAAAAASEVFRWPFASRPTRNRPVPRFAYSAVLCV